MNRGKCDFPFMYRVKKDDKTNLICLLPMSQMSPSKPAAHSHVNELTPSVHTPSLRHGL